MKAESLRTTHLGSKWYPWYLEPFTHWIIIQILPKLCFSLLNFIYIVTLAKYLQVVDFNFSFILHCILWKKLYEWYSKFQEFSKIIEALNLSSKDSFSHMHIRYHIVDILIPFVTKGKNWVTESLDEVLEISWSMLESGKKKTPPNSMNS